MEHEYSNKKYVIFNNQIVDLSNLIHPGGQFIWDQVNGREISRYIFGAYGLESSEIKPHKHSEYALKLLENYTIERLNSFLLFSQD